VETALDRNPIWDIPTRLIHWLFVIGVVVAWWSAETQRYDLHEWNGYAILVLVISRLIWGFVGSKHSRFVDFVRGPRKVLSYVRGALSKNKFDEAENKLGHNPLGACSVVLLLTALLVQAISGLFNSDDILFSGPFYYAADSSWQGIMGVAHEWAFNVLLALIVLHLVAVAYYQYKGGDILRPMFRGYSGGRFASTKPVAVWYWLLIVGLLAAVLWWLIQQAPQPTTNWW